MSLNQVHSQWSPPPSLPRHSPSSQCRTRTVCSSLPPHFPLLAVPSPCFSGDAGICNPSWETKFRSPSPAPFSCLWISSMLYTLERVSHNIKPLPSQLHNPNYKLLSARQNNCAFSTCTLGSIFQFIQSMISFILDNT